MLREDQEGALGSAVRALGKAADCQLVVKKEGSWRANESYFSRREGAILPVGVASYSPSWFTQGHPVSRNFALQSGLNEIY
jgi:hypothetical protein